MIRKILCLMLSVCMLLTLSVPARAAGKDAIKPYAEKLIQYYLHHQEAADDVIWDILQQMAEIDPKQAQTWKNIMDSWSWVNSKMPVYENALPEGLPEDDSLCIVVMGYGLKEDGSMKEELVDRLVVALASAVSYPNAWVLVTGGQTGQVDGVTEAGQMAKWLKNKGLDESRLILEKASLSTTANAVNVHKLLVNGYPQVKNVAVITSDYHLSWSCAMFTTVFHYKSGYEGLRHLELVAGAVCDTGGTFDSLATQAWGISAITGVSFDEKEVPDLYYVDRPTEPAVVPEEETEAEYSWFWHPKPKQENGQAEEASAEPPAEKKRSVGPVVVLVILAAAAYVLTPKKPKKKNRRQKPKMNWDLEE